MRTRLRRSAALAALLALSPGLISCLYLNTLFNGRKAWKTAESSRTDRLRKNPADTTTVSKDEETQYRRAIAKGSKVMELWPKDSSWHPDALILIGRSQQRLGECGQAIRTFQVLVDGYPGSKREQAAVQGCVECLLEMERFREAEEWMARLDSLRAEGGAAGLAWLRARLALGRLDTARARSELGRLLAMRKVDPKRRAEAAWLKGGLDWEQRAWSEARTSYLDRDIRHLPRPRRHQARLRAGIALDRLGEPDSAVAELEALAGDPLFDSWQAETWLELGRLLLDRGFFTRGLAALAKLEVLTTPPEKVAEGLLLAGDDARLRRLDIPEAKRLYDLAARVGKGTDPGRRAAELAAALDELLKLRGQAVADTARARWNFSLAELQLLRLSSPDSAKAAYRRVLGDSSASREDRARADYAIAWIEVDARPDSLAPDPGPWLRVAGAWPGTEFAKVAQRNAGVSVTERTREDSAEVVYRDAERIWLDQQNPSGAIAAYEAVAAAWHGTEAAKRAWYAVAWLQDNERADSAAATAAYRRVVDSLPGTAWAARAKAILDGEIREDDPGRAARRQDQDFDEGLETLDGRRVIRRDAPTLQKPPEEPEAIPPAPEDILLTPDDFQ